MSRKTQIWLAITCLLASLSGWCFSTDDIQTFHLDDGTQVLLLEDYRAPLVSIEVNFLVNLLMPWSIENNAQVAFEGQTMDSDRSIRKREERLGIGMSASMGWRNARIGGSSLASDFPELVRLMKDTLNNRDYSKQDVKKWQRDHVLAWKTNQTSPRSALGEAALALIYPDPQDPRQFLYAKPKSVRFNADEFANVRDRVIAATERNIAVSGAINKAELLELLHDLLPAKNESNSFADTASKPASLSSGTSKTIEFDDLTQVYVGLARDSLPFVHEDYPAYLIVNQVLGGGFSSRLYEKIRHEFGDSYSATLSTLTTTATRPGMLMIRTYTRLDNAEAMEQRLSDVLHTIHEKGINEEEVERALSFLRGRRIFAQQTPNGVVNEAAVNLLHGLPANFLDVAYDQAERLSLAEINDFARDFYNPDKFALVKVVPK